MRKKRVCLMTEVIFIGAISNKNGKTIRLLFSTILKAAKFSLVEQLIILHC